MSYKKFDEFVDRENKKKTENGFDVEKELKEWKEYLSLLYSFVRNTLSDHIDKGKIQVDTNEKQIHEQSTGTYFVEKLTLTIGNHKVYLDPVGTFLIGAKGRVDMIGDSGEKSFLLVNKNSSWPPIKIKVKIAGENQDNEEEEREEQPPPQWEWRIWDNSTSMSLTELNEKNFLDSLIEVSGG